MNLGEIKREALDKLLKDGYLDAEDVFSRTAYPDEWINRGYQVAMYDYIKPRKILDLKTNEKGAAFYDEDDCSVAHFERLMKEDGSSVPFFHLVGGGVQTPLRNTKVRAICRVHYPGMVYDSDVPASLSEEACHALADYACYRYLVAFEKITDRSMFNWDMKYLVNFIRTMQKEGAAMVAAKQTETHGRSDTAFNAILGKTAAIVVYDEFESKGESK